MSSPLSEQPQSTQFAPVLQTPQIPHPTPFGQEEMYVTKRTGKTEIISFDKILRRLRRLGTEANLKINYTTLTMKVIDQLYDKIPSTKIDELSADQCASLASTHPDYNTLAGRIVVSNHHRSTNVSFSKVMKQLYEFKDANGINCPMISKELYQLVSTKGKELDAICKYDRDYFIDYFGFKTLEKSYLMKINRNTVERPQHMWLRVSLGIHGQDIDAARETYEAMSQKYFTHATPTLFNAGTPRPQLSSCFLLSMESDSIDGIYNTLKDCANISKWAGGIGLHIHNIRAQGSHIRGTNGSSNGIVPMLRVFNNTAKYVDQCVTGDTHVLSVIGYKPISQFKEGDIVCNREVPEPGDFSKEVFYMTNDTKGVDDVIPVGTGINGKVVDRGRVKKVVIHEVTDVDILLIYTKSINDRQNLQQPLRITDKHPIFAIRKENVADIKARGEWIEAGELSEGDHLLFGVGKIAYRIIERIEHAKFTGELCDLEIDTDGKDGSSPNYLTPHGLLHNGGGKRNGSFAIYLEPWHADVEMFLQMRKNHGDEELKARDLFYALWIPDLFMQRVKDGGQWTLMCPDECPGLADCYGDEFVELYTKYEQEGRGKKTMVARDLWFQVLDAQMETGTPYILFKDACNRKSNQKNLGVIKSSNLCVAPETLVLTDMGHVVIKDICGKMVKVWNGEEWSIVLIEKTGINQELVEVKTSTGESLNCTKYHKFYVVERHPTTGGLIVVEREAKDLKPGDKLKRCAFPVIKGAHLKSVFDWLSSMCDSCKKTRIENGHLIIEEDDDQPRDNQDMFLEAKYLFQTCGVNPKMEITEDVQKLGNEKRRLVISQNGLITLEFYGFRCKIVDVVSGCVYNSFEGPLIEWEVVVTDVVDNGRRDDTYCFNEPMRHMGVFNGILTGQCTEIVEYSAPDETAVCNLASIGLPMFVNLETKTFDFAHLHSIVKMATRNLNKVIDINFYPTEKTQKSNMRHRPIGLGVQGLADVFIQMDMPFYSDTAKQLNREIFETIYHAAVEQSIELAKVNGHYETFPGSPASKGELQFDMWNVIPSARYDWGAIRQELETYGMRNSLLVAPMPTASTSQILGFNECIEPITSNIYSRRTMAGEFILANKYLMTDLIKLDLWNEKIKNNIIANNGSIQHIDVIPQELRDKYKTVWEISMRDLIDMAADRGAYICQSQSLNLWLEDPNYNSLTSMHFYSWKKGLKTGIYYLRRRAKHQAQQFTIEPDKRVNGGGEDEHDICEYCSS
jgi:ribonucleotide reductase alpha subunit